MTIAETWLDSIGASKEDIEQARLDRAAELRARLDREKPDEGLDELGEGLSQEVSLELAEISKAAQESLDFLAAIAIPDVYKYAFPPLYLTLWEMLRAELTKIRNFPQIALGLPRGFAKTGVLKLLILYVILFTQKRYILVLCENEQKAKNIVADVESMLDEPNIVAAFGNWRLGQTQDTQTLKKFGFRGRNIVLQGAGAGTGIRGITIDNRRPDLMIFDDIQSKEDSKSEVLSNELEEWMYGTAMKAKDPEGCMFLFVANMYPNKGSLLRRIKLNPQWVKYIVGGILQDGSSLWEELHPIAQLEREFQNDIASGHPEIFYSEVLNDELATAHTQLNLSSLQYPFEDDEIHMGNFVIIDPSGNKKKSDPTSVAYCEVHGNSKPCLIDLEEGRMSPGDTIRAALKFCLERRCSLIVIESNGYQASLGYWFTFICEQMGIEGIQCVEIYSGGQAKSIRILSSFKELMSGDMHIKPGGVAYAKFAMQVMYFDPLRNDNDDGVLDCVTYMPRVVQEYGHMLKSTTVWDALELSQKDVDTVNTNF